MSSNGRPALARVVTATLVLAAGLLVAGWFDYQATRRDLLTVLVEQAASLRQAVAAAARSAEAATAQAQASLTARLLDNARLLDRLDGAGQLNQAALDAIARDHRLFRVTFFSAEGVRQLSAGAGGPPAGAGRGAGAGFGSAIAERLLRGGESEAVSEVHGSQWGRGWRLAAGVRRSTGGAIVLNVDAADLAELRQQASLDHLLEDITAGAPEVAYVILVDANGRTAHGRLAEQAVAAPASPSAESEALPLARQLAGLTAYELEVGGTPILEFAGPIDPAVQGRPVLRLGLSLEGLRGAERRSLTRLVILLAAALGLGALTLAFAGLRKEHGALREEHARAQAALRRRDRLAAMGELASTVAHEVRNPLNAIGMSVQRLRREFTDVSETLPADAREEQRELLEVLASETARINRIVQQFLEFARPPRIALQRVNLAPLLSDVTVAARALADTRGVRLEYTPADVGEAVVDPDQFRQALGNLVRNAIEASPRDGAVSVRAARSDRGHRIVVEDNGPGIDPGHVAKIFDLYFTTKADGTGVGLAVTHQIVDAHNGTIEVDTQPGRGTRMIVNVPLGLEAVAHV